MPEISDDSVDLIVTSPPYPMIQMWDDVFRGLSVSAAEALDALDGRRAFEAMHVVLDKVWAECARVLRPGGFMCINIGDATRKIGDNFRLYTNHSRITQAVESLGFESLPAVIWWKSTNAPNKFMGSGTLPSGAYVTLEHEYILVFRKGGKRVFGKDEAELRRRSAYFWEERNQWFSDSWNLSGVRQNIGDPQVRSRSAAFPLELPFRLVNMYSLQGETVLDPFGGTGTTAFAAAAAGRNSLSIELDRGFAEIMQQGFAAALPGLRKRQLQRLDDHLLFVDKRGQEGKPALKHRNEYYGFPVMSSQECKLQLPVLCDIQPASEMTWSAIYEETLFSQNGP